ncbi:hypothetical protein [Endozoicomonas sp. SCSIO W0465]|uniref:hypothetical protein n=1 Tax=Endozoicomonas sp. SCSIO W0465 TaxID=2918516 RepID=UPI002075DB65|nr:hypothetical protein [Endozoicomonas sp. SCSIO W0465]USE36404.1 hypothetical protein MJO57_31025 [Endozoicomonas sp. SCSIO W0465]
MDVVNHDLNRYLASIDAAEAFEDAVERQLEGLESEFLTDLQKNSRFKVSGFQTFTPLSFLHFLLAEEFHPMQGLRWLAVKQLVSDCNGPNARYSGWDIINYASKRGYCHG